MVLKNKTDNAGKNCVCSMCHIAGTKEKSEIHKSLFPIGCSIYFHIYTNYKGIYSIYMYNVQNRRGPERQIK